MELNNDKKRLEEQVKKEDYGCVSAGGLYARHLKGNMKTIIIQLDETENPKYIRLDINNGAGTVESNLAQVCPFCQNLGCYSESKQGCNPASEEPDYEEDEADEELIKRREYNAAIDGMESFVLSLICTGQVEQFDLESPGFKQAILNALDAIDNNS